MRNKVHGFALMSPHGRSVHEVFEHFIIKMHEKLPYLGSAINVSQRICLILGLGEQLVEPSVSRMTEAVKWRSLMGIAHPMKVNNRPNQIGSPLLSEVLK